MLSTRRLLPLSLIFAFGNAPLLPGQGTKTLEAVLEGPIQETGLEIDRSKIQADPAGGWSAQYGSDPSKGWQRVIRVHVTDGDFLAGKYPVVDIETTFRTAPSVQVSLEGKTTEGVQSLMKERMPGRNPEEWRTRRISIDHFAPDGKNDLIISTANALTLKDIKVTGYDLSKDVDWSRLLRIGDISGPQDGGVLLFERGGSQKLSVPLTNLARIPCSIAYTLRISDFAAPVQKSEGEITIAPGGSEVLGFEFDTAKLPLGPYEGVLEIRLADSPAKALLARSFRLGLITESRLEKARPGEFLYGLDPANNFQHAIHTPATFAYFRLMGVDILRNPYNTGMTESVENAGQALQALAGQDLQSMIMVDPPKETDAGKRAATLEKKVAFLKELSRKYAGSGPGKYHYYELGNEPDLPVFYPNLIPAYLESYYAMYDAVKTGAQEGGVPGDGTVVMNGGLSFAHETGDRRSREFLSLIDPKRIDAIAYHGHGPGIEAERMAYERVLTEARKHGKENIPFVETESGTMGTDHSTLIDQARTVVEKQAFAQSVGQPFLMYFRLVMKEGQEGGYGMTERITEPRPSVLSYRNMVERLRHQSFVRPLDFAGKSGAEGVNGYLFEGRDAQGKADGRKTVLAFNEHSARHNLLVRLGQPGSTVSSTRLYDMFGNTLPLEIVSGNVASFAVGPDPVYLSWDSPDAAETVDALAPLLRADIKGPLLTGAANRVTLALTNPGGKPLEIGVQIAGHSRVSLQVEPTDVTLSLPVSQPRDIPLGITLGQPSEPLRLPVWWKVFLDVDGNALSPEQLSIIPATLPAKSGESAGEYAWTPEQVIGFAKLAGGFSEWRAATAFAYMDSPKAVELRVAAKPDYWMAWFVNGRKVYDAASDRARGGGDFGSHSFTLPLRAGRNTIAVTGFSGRGGWSVRYAGPKELALFTSGGIDPDRLTVTITDATHTIAQADVPLELQGPVPPLGDIRPANDVQAWMPLEPLALLSSTEVTNLWVKEPDQTRWYKGQSDLSAIVWARQTPMDLQILARVSDDASVTAPAPEGLAQHDAMRIVLAAADGTPFLDATGGMVNGSPAVKGSQDARYAIQRIDTPQGPVTVYHVTIPRSAIPAEPFRLNLSVLDNDAGYLKQTLDLGSVGTPQAGPPLSL